MFDSNRFHLHFVRTLRQVRQPQNFHIIGWVLMPEHFHLLLWPSEHANPSAIIPPSFRVSRSVPPNSFSFTCANMPPFRGVEKCFRSLLCLQLFVAFDAPRLAAPVL
ncbi:MAG: hypothetical protein ACRD10_15250 [Terriglobia bacterium]